MLVTWNTFVHPWQVSYKWSSTACPSSNGITAQKFLNFFHPSPIFVHFEGKFWMEIRNFSRQFDWNRFLEYDKQNIANGGGPGWKLNRCPRFLVNPENSSEPRHAILELPFTAKSLSSPRVLVRIIQMDRDISLFPRDFLGSPPPPSFFLIRLKTTILIRRIFSRKYFSLPNLTSLFTTYERSFFHTSGCFLRSIVGRWSGTVYGLAKYFVSRLRGTCGLLARITALSVFMNGGGPNGGCTHFDALEEWCT